ncbi:MAG: Gfo/Idh/MocA family oxidoreductase [Oscillospiraceae bacterium]|nr:Gfo/Idh/MocA family oxidoreductase [Oscillospiraceae bacterium]
MGKVKVGIIGCGNISQIYLENCGKVYKNLEVAAVADLIHDRAKAKASEHGIAKACTVGELLADPEIKIVVNLTIPNAHADVCLKALEAGKSVYVEKPLSVSRDDGRRIKDLAAKKGLLAGGAPDTFLGGGIQTCRKIIDDGWIGRPIAATAFMMGHGHETWHPDPEFYYKPGGGPLFDMGPYYIHALVNLLGPIRRVSASAKAAFETRLITSQPKHGTVIKVETPTHLAGTLDFECGAVGTVIMSFDIWGHTCPCIEIYGSEGTIKVPDPNTFGGPVLLKRYYDGEWVKMPLTHGYTENARGLGVADMASALVSGRKPRAGVDLTFHTLDVMQGFLDSSDSGRSHVPETRCERPAMMPSGLALGEID